MKVILRETIESLGTVGDEVTVADGYGRNYLVPQKKAVLATPANRKLIERERNQLELRTIKDKNTAEAMAKNIHSVRKRSKKESFLITLSFINYLSLVSLCRC